MHLEINEVLPLIHPLLKQRRVIRLHKLIAEPQFFINPTRHIHKPLRSHPSASSKSAVHRRRVSIPEMLDYHIQLFHSERTTITHAK